MKTIVKLIDYNFQRESQLVEAYDDSNSMRGLNSELKRYVIGRHGNQISIHEVEDYEVIFLPTDWDIPRMFSYILSLCPDVLHMHGNHGWPSYPLYAKFFRSLVKKMIFSPAGSSCGTPEFLSYFDHIIVNHSLQVARMKCSPSDREKIIVRRRAADPKVFKVPEIIRYPPEFDLVYVAGFVPVKQIPTMMSYAINSSKSLAIVGDISRTYVHYSEINDLIMINHLYNQISIIPFMSQSRLVKFFGKCGVFVWPNIRPENPSTTTNRAVIEGLACGLPLLLGERAFKDTEFLVEGYNGYTYSDLESFKEKAEWILKDLNYFRNNSLALNKERFSFEENFIRFYNDLYGS